MEFSGLILSGALVALGIIGGRKIIARYRWRQYRANVLRHGWFDPVINPYPSRPSASLSGSPSKDSSVRH